MCLAILKPVGKHIIKRRLREGFRQNPDGAGFMYVVNGKLKIDKGYFSFRSFYRAYRQTEQKYPDSNFVIHFRIATSGKIDVNTCHPFLIDKTTGFVHNGIFVKLGNKVKSDTQQFAKDYLKYMPPNFIYKEKSIKFLEKFCGCFNKLVFLNSKNDYLIINESAGQWLDDIWFSNQIESVFDYDFDDENWCWDNCVVCRGYFPIDEMLSAENGQIICQTCFDIASNTYKQHICYQCGRAFDIYDDDSFCPYCGADVEKVWV